MPRLTDIHGDPHDFCNWCFFLIEDEAKEMYGSIKTAQLEPDGPPKENKFAYDVEHPPYEEEDYRCTYCGDKLGQEDN